MSEHRATLTTVEELERFMAGVNKTAAEWRSKGDDIRNQKERTDAATKLNDEEKVAALQDIAVNG